jgi:hypothetical protein
MRRVPHIFFSILFFAAFSGYGQMIDSMMKVYAEEYPQEKLYLQLDKNVYNPGEAIWFKAYIFSGTEPSSVSRNFYAELSDAQGNIMQHFTAPLYESTASGFFAVPAGYQSNHLHLRAYTEWMLNFDSTFYFERDILVSNATRDSAIERANETRYLQFLPEGGELIAGVENNIAFTATDGFGKPIAVSGDLKDASGKEILEFNSVHDGMGKFLLTPDPDDKFIAFWKDDHGVSHQTALPDVKSEGIVLRLMSTKKKVFFSIARSSGNDQRLKHVTVIGHMNQQMLYKAQVNLSDNFMSGGSIPTDQLPSGLLTVTAFFQSTPLAERVVFINNEEFQFSPEVTIEQKNLNRRGSNALEIAVPDSLSCNLSLSVTDADADGEGTDADNIYSRLLLTSELKGQIFHPAYYFTGPADSAEQYLDLVMLTHGWRRFKWDQLARGKIPVIKYPVQNYLSVQAMVYGVDPTRIARNESINVFLRRKDSSVQMMQVPRQTGGRFGVGGMVFYDTANAFYQFNTNRKLSDEAAVVFSNGLYSGTRTAKPLTSVFEGWTPKDTALLRRTLYFKDQSDRAKTESDKKVQVLPSVTFTGRQKSATEKLDEEYTSGLFSSGDAMTFDLVNDPSAASYMDVITYLAGRVAGLQINPSTGSMTWRNSTPTLWLNEVQADPQQLKEMPMSDVAMIKVFRPGTMIGPGGSAGGAIAVYMKKGNEKRIDPNIKGLDKAIVVGYSPVKVFFSPDYEKNPQVNFNARDVRSTLYWKPYVLLDKSNTKSTIRFFNNDVSKRLRIVLEGFDSEGKLARVEKIIE